MTIRATILLLCLTLTFFSADAQIRKIPADVTDAFRTRYPHAERVSWKDQLNSFEAQFMLNNFEMSANFSGTGEWIRSERKLKCEDLHGGVKDGFEKSKYTDWEKGSIFEIARNMEALQYRILVKKSGLQKKYLFFDVNVKLSKESFTL